MRATFTALLMLFATPLWAVTLNAPFENIDGGTFTLEDFSGQPVLVVNTASQCGFTGQYAGLQRLYDRYRDDGLVVVAIPSDDFNQELATNEKVKEFCEAQFGLDMPMAGITNILGSQAHPFYASLRDQTGFAPSWNFNKVLISPEGEVVETWGSSARPMSSTITGKIEALLN